MAPPTGLRKLQAPPQNQQRVLDQMRAMKEKFEDKKQERVDTNMEDLLDFDIKQPEEQKKAETTLPTPKP